MASSCGDDRHVRQALHEDVVQRDQPIELAHRRVELVEPGEDLVAPALGHVERDAAHAVVVVREPRAAQLLDEVVHELALAQRPREGRHRADVHGHRAERDHVAGDAVQLARDDAQVLGALRDLDVHQLLAGRGPALVREHRRDVVDAVGVRHVALVGATLADLLDGAVQVAHVGHGLADDLAVRLDDEAEHPVRGRVVRTHVQGHLLVHLVREDDLTHGSLTLYFAVSLDGGLLHLL
jgi:hypothetical protein